MSEKQFELVNGIITDMQDNERMYGIFELVDLLNDFSEENKKLKEEWEFSFRTEMAHHRFAEKELQEKIREKQATIDKQELRLQQLEELLELSENLNKSYREKLIDMNLKMVVDDE